MNDLFGIPIMLLEVGDETYVLDLRLAYKQMMLKPMPPEPRYEVRMPPPAMINLIDIVNIAI